MDINHRTLIDHDQFRLTLSLFLTTPYDPELLGFGKERRFRLYKQAVFIEDLIREISGDEHLLKLRQAKRMTLKERQALTANAGKARNEWYHRARILMKAAGAKEGEPVS